MWPPYVLSGTLRFQNLIGVDRVAVHGDGAIGAVTRILRAAQMFQWDLRPEFLKPLFKNPSGGLRYSDLLETYIRKKKLFIIRNLVF